MRHFIMLTCCVWDSVRVPGVLAAVSDSTFRCQLHSVGERPVTDLVGGRDFHQVDIPRLQLLQQGHRMGSCKQKQKHTRITNTENRHKGPNFLLINIYSMS